ncbi:DUF1064 domain-containing protein [Oligella sp. HMSC09E12]|uniref:DUF1064 domain-containing protein n=1 Tax=Oligella sp. HMSC09E12 TaxID=1581147 RepID=UPI0009F2937F|nr:DUF1064 domain-containing protein [Oligella sp. HMSC09E12]
MKRRKYGNKKVKYDGHTFDSQAEYRRYLDLKLLEKAGKISDLQLQVPFVLADGVKYSDAKRATPAMKYYADFVYKDHDGLQVVEDVKGVKTALYKAKRHLMLANLGIEIQEIKK